MIYTNYLKDLYAYFKGFVQIIETIYRKSTEELLGGRALGRGLRVSKWK